MGRPMPSSGTCGSDSAERLLAGYLNHMDLSKRKIKKRWIVFQGNQETGLYQLKLYRKDGEKVLKRAYTISKANFVGTEKGTLEKSKKSKTPLVYWAIILEDETIFFQHHSTSTWIRSEIEEWNNTFMAHFQSVSYLVYPKAGFIMAEDELSLHISDQNLSLVSLNPPNCCIRLELSRIHGCRVNENVLGFHVRSSGSDAGYFEIRCESNSVCQRIRSSIEGIPCRLVKQSSTCSAGSGCSRFPLKKDWSFGSSTSSPTLSKARYTPCPTSPLRPRKTPSEEWTPTPPIRFDLDSSDLHISRQGYLGLHFTESIHLDVASLSSSSEASSSLFT